MDYPFYVPIFLSMFVISVATDCATFKQREPGKIMDVSFKSIIFLVVTTIFFIFMYYILPASLITICVRWIAGLSPLPEDTDLAYLDAVMKTALIICMADNFADVIAFKPGRETRFFKFITNALVLFPLGFFAVMAFCLGYLKIFFKNSIYVAPAAIYNIAFVPNLEINRILLIVFLFVFSLVSYVLMKFRQPGSDY